MLTMPIPATRRIDAGIRRGPRNLARTIKQRRLSPVPACNSKLADLDPTAVIDRYLQDEQTSSIAASLGVHRSGLHQWLLRNCEAEWQQAQIARALTALEAAKDTMREASDALSLARGRELLRGAQWELERLFGRLYGQKQEVSLTANVTMSPAMLVSATQLLERALGRTIDGVAEDVTDVTDEIVNQNLSST